MADHGVAQSAFLASISRPPKPIADLDNVLRIAGGSIPLNIVVAAAAALIHSGRRRPDYADRLLRELPAEAGSPLYGAWAAGVVATLAHRSPVAMRWYESWLAANALCLCPRVDKLRLNDGEWRDRSGAVAVSAWVGNRATWNRGKASMNTERAPGAYLASEALGIATYRYRHDVFDWAVDAALDHGPKVDFRGLKPEDLVDKLIPTRGSQQFTIMHGSDRRVFVAMSVTTMNTRGPVTGVYYDGRNRLQLFSPSKPTGRGQWTSAQSKMSRDGDGKWTWESWQTGGGGERLEFAVPFDPTRVILWGPGDRKQILRRGDAPRPSTGDEPPPNPDPQPGPQEPPTPIPGPSSRLPDSVPETAQVLALLDGVGRGLKVQGAEVDGPDRDDVLRSLAEVMRRVVEGSKESAVKGCEDTLRKMDELGW